MEKTAQVIPVEPEIAPVADEPTALTPRQREKAKFLAAKQRDTDQLRRLIKAVGTYQKKLDPQEIASVSLNADGTGVVHTGEAGVVVHFATPQEAIIWLEGSKL